MKHPTSAIGSGMTLSTSIFVLLRADMLVLPFAQGWGIVDSLSRRPKLRRQTLVPLLLDQNM
jgi:hypothetical protein